MTGQDLFNFMYHQLGYTEETFAEFLMVHCNETGVSSSSIDNAFTVIQQLNDRLPYRHNGYQYDQYNINEIVGAWSQIASILGMQANPTNGIIIFVSPIGNAAISFHACVDSQYGNVKPVENRPKIIKNTATLNKIYKGNVVLNKIYKGNTRIF